MSALITLLDLSSLVACVALVAAFVAWVLTGDLAVAWTVGAWGAGVAVAAVLCGAVWSAAMGRVERRLRP